MQILSEDFVLRLDFILKTLIAIQIKMLLVGILLKFVFYCIVNWFLNIFLMMSSYATIFPLSCFLT